MDINEVKDLMSQFDQSSLKEFDLKEGSFEIYMNKNDSTRVVNFSTPVNQVPVEVPAPAVKEPEQTASFEAEKTAQKPASEAGKAQKEISSPIVGVVYLQSAPEDPAFKQVGDTVKQGDIVCIVEAMKVMNEIISDIDGVIEEILVENEQVVEFGQPLFRVR